MTNEPELKELSSDDREPTGACIWCEGDAQRCGNGYTKAQCDHLGGQWFQNDNCQNYIDYDAGCSQ